MPLELHSISISISIAIAISIPLLRSVLIKCKKVFRLLGVQIKYAGRTLQRPRDGW